jgi:hypothetical protein
LKCDKIQRDGDRPPTPNVKVFVVVGEPVEDQVQAVVLVVRVVVAPISVA